MTQQYIIVRLEDAKLLARIAVLSEGVAAPELKALTDRIAAEEGANIGEIAYLMKHQGTCPACNIEMQQHSCCNIETKALGRRLSRLIDRAEGRHVDHNPGPSPSRLIDNRSWQALHRTIEVHTEKVERLLPDLQALVDVGLVNPTIAHRAEPVAEKINAVRASLGQLKKDVGPASRIPRK